MSPAGQAILESEGLRSDLAKVVRRRVDPADVDDVVQATLLEVISASRRPETPADVWHFSLFIARQKIADVCRRRGREACLSAMEGDVEAEIAAEAALVIETEDGARDLLRWVDRVLPETQKARQTFDWMLREGEGDSLAEIAQSERVSAVVVRQRVSRLRRFLRRRWAREAAAGAILVLLVVAFSAVANRPRAPEANEPTSTSTKAKNLPTTLPKPKASCDPPFEVDAAGRRRYRRECLRP